MREVSGRCRNVMTPTHSSPLLTHMIAGSYFTTTSGGRGIIRCAYSLVRNKNFSLEQKFLFGTENFCFGTKISVPYRNLCSEILVVRKLKRPGKRRKIQQHFPKKDETLMGRKMTKIKKSEGRLSGGRAVTGRNQGFKFSRKNNAFSTVHKIWPGSSENTGCRK